MDSYSLLPSHNIKLEPVCETDHVHSSDKVTAAEVQISDIVDSKLPVSFKIEPPEEKLRYPDQETLTCPQIVSSLPLQEHSQMEKLMYGNMNFKFVKQELSNELCEDKHQRFDKRIDLTDCSSGLEITGHSKTESRMPQNSCDASQEHENCSQISDNVSSTFKMSTKHSLVNSDQLQNSGDISCKSSRIRKKNSFIYTNCESYINKGKKAGDKSCISDVCDSTVSVNSCLIREESKCTIEKPFKCDDCGACFAQAGNLNKHKRTHTGERPYKCDDCDASFSESGQLKIHKRTHTGERPYTCDDCGASFTQSGNLKTHKRTHTGERPYKCDDCDASFAEAGSLKNHKRIHTGERPFKCDDCGACFAQVVNLNKHKRTHTGERPYKCDDCGACFTLTGSLKNHKRTHTGERPFKCDTCGASFTQAVNLKKHKRTHTGEKRYKCDDCGVSFAVGIYLNFHMTTHTGE